jgi:hypothetical protein
MAAANVIRFPCRVTPVEPSLPPAGLPGNSRPAVGVAYLIEAAGGEDAVIRAAARRLSRVFGQANALEAAEAIEMVLFESAPEALAQLGDSASRTAQEAARQLRGRLDTPRY